MKKTFLIGLSLLFCLSVLTGCTQSSVTSVTNIQPVTLEEVAGKRLIATTSSEKEAEIYNLVSGRIIVDKNNLIEVDDTDRRNITKLFSNINMMLQGRKKDFLSDEYANYLLLEFAKTPYEWEQRNIDIVGFDPAARLYFVDVTYSTTSRTKSVVPNSVIPNGAPNEEQLKQKRYTDYLTVLTYKYNEDEKYSVYADKFVKAWGDPQVILEEQQGASLLERSYKTVSTMGGIGHLTYAGLIGESRFGQGANMTIRYVLKYRLNLGEETDLGVSALYLKDYEVKGYDDVLAKYEGADTNTVEVLKPFIKALILSYNKSVEENNTIGLYNTFVDYGNIDKYYEELDKYTYNDFEGYTYKILKRDGKEVIVQVNRTVHYRAKGANMSLPTYDETVVFTLEMGMDDTLRIKYITPLKSTLIGEPLSVIRNVTGISDAIQYSAATFTDTNKSKVETLIKEFSAVVANKDVDSNEFLKTVDLGVSQTTLARIADTINAITPTKKFTYIVSWDTQTNVYTSVTLREVFVTDKGNYDTESVLDMVNRNGVWKVVNYTRTVNIKTLKNDIQGDTAFCIDAID